MTDGADRVDPWIFVEFLGEKRQVQFTMRSAKLFSRLTTKASLFGEYDFTDPEQQTAFFIAGLVEHQRDLVGKVDARGVPDAKMLDLIERIDAMDISQGAIPNLLGQFIDALQRAKPKRSEAELGNEQTK